MKEDNLYIKEVDYILNDGYKNTIKCILFDGESIKRKIDSLVNYNDLLKSNYFHFDYLENNLQITDQCLSQGQENSVSPVECIVLLKSSNIHLMLKELENPSFISYKVCFTDIINSYILEILGNSDIYGNITQVIQINISLFKIDNFLYSIKSGNSINEDIKIIRESFIEEFNEKNISFYKLNSNNEKIEKILKREEIENLLENNNKEISSIKESANQKRSNIKCLIIEDRYSFDSITPNIPTFTYQSLLYTHMNLSINNSIVTLKNKKLSNINKFNLSNDWFYKKYKFENIHNINDKLKQLENKIQIMKDKFHNEENLSSSSSTKASLLEFINKETNILTTHSSIYTYLMEIILENENIYKELFTKLELEKEDYKKIHKFYYSFDKSLPTLLSFIPPIEKLIKKFITSSFPIYIIYVKPGISYFEYYRLLLLGEKHKIRIYIIINKII